MKIQSFSKRTAFLLILFAAWTFAVLIVNPQGEFPLNDDWAYSRVTQLFLQTGELRFPGEIAVPLLTPLLWSSLFGKLFGFSFTVLRFSTLFLGLIGIFFLYFILEEASVPAEITLFGALSLAFNPLYFQLSHSFMTDVPFVVWGLASFFFFFRSMRTNSKWDVAWGSTFACAAILTRQFAVVIPLSYGATYLLQNGAGARQMIKAFLPALISIALLLSFQTFLQATGRLPADYNHPISFVLEAGFGKARWISWSAYNFVRVWIYLGLFILPILVLIFNNVIGRLTFYERLTCFLLTTLFSLVVLILLARSRKIMPLLPNLLNYYGFGPNSGTHHNTCRKFQNLSEFYLQF